MTPLRLIEIALASWYLAFALTATHGPGDVFEWIREHVWHGRRAYFINRPDGDQEHVTHNGLLDCIICLAPWIALVLWLVPDGVMIWAFAAAGLGLILHGWSGWRYNV